MNPRVKHEFKHDTTTPAAFRINDLPVSEQAFYAVALDPRRSVAVEACAGSGKTWMLINRMVSALQQGCPAEGILAITFTKKAAAEMRQRLEDALLEPQHAALRQRLIAEGAGVQIQTFHAWFAQLVKAAPIAVLEALGLPPRYQVRQEVASALSDLRLAFYQAVSRDESLKKVFAELLQEVGRHHVLQALTDLLDKRIEFAWTDRQGLLEESVLSVQQTHEKFANLPMKMSHSDLEWLTADDQLVPAWLQCAKTMGRFTGVKLQQAAAELEMATAGSVDGVIAALLTEKYQPKKQLFTKAVCADSLAMTTIEQAQNLALHLHGAREQHRAWAYHQKMVQLGRAWLAAYASIKRQQGWIDMADLEQTAWTLLSDPQLCGAVHERLDMRLRHVLIDEFQDTNPLQWQALHSWLSGYAGSGGGMDRPSLFIVGDPKQSIYRFRRAEPRVFAAAQNFMQEAFSADVLRCDHTRRCAQAILDVVNPSLLALQEQGGYSGFRSHTTQSTEPGGVWLLPSIAKIDSASKAANDDSEHVLQIHAQNVDPNTKTKPSPLQLRDHLETPKEVVEPSDLEREVLQAAQWIYRHWDRRQTLMVLSRNHDPLELMEQAMLELGLPNIRVLKSKLTDDPAVQDLVALLGVLVSPSNDLDLVRTLKSPLWQWRDEDLLQLRALQLQGQLISDPMRQGDEFAQTPTQKPFQMPSLWQVLPLHAKGPLVLPILLRWQSWVQNLPPHDALQAIYDDGQVLERYQQAMPKHLYAATQQALKALLWSALELEGGHFLHSYGVLRKWRAKVQSISMPAPLPNEQAATIKLLTVHGAKGLQADIVLVLNAYHTQKATQTRSSLIDWQPDDPAPNRFIFLQSEKQPPVCTQDLLERELQARAIEEINTAYVALTRARQHLIISGHGEPTVSVWQMVSRLATPHPDQTPHSQAQTSWRVSNLDAIQSPSAIAVLQGNPLPKPRQNVMGSAVQRPMLLAAKPQESIQIRMGLALHRLLQWQHATPVRDPLGVGSESMASMIALPAPQVRKVQREFDLDDAQVAKVLEHVNHMRCGSAAWLWDTQQIDWQSNEYELLHQGQWLRIDRLVKNRRTQHWWIIDFKSASQVEMPHSHRMQPSHSRQLSAYVDALVSNRSLSRHHVQAAILLGTGELLML